MYVDVTEVVSAATVVKMDMGTHDLTRTLPRGLDESAMRQMLLQVAYAQPTVDNHVLGRTAYQPDVGAVALEEVHLPRQVDVFSHLPGGKPAQGVGLDSLFLGHVTDSYRPRPGVLKGYQMELLRKGSYDNLTWVKTQHLKDYTYLYIVEHTQYAQ